MEEKERGRKRGRKEGKRGKKEEKRAIEKPASASHSLPFCVLCCNLVQCLEDPEKATNTREMSLITP